MKNYRDTITSWLINSKADTISTAQAYAFYQKDEKNVPITTVIRRLHSMTEEGLIERVGRGFYQLPQKYRHRFTNNSISREMKNIGGIMNESFPLVKWCIWSLDLLKTLTQHIPGERYYILDIEKDSISPVYATLNEKMANIYMEDDYNRIKEHATKNITPIVARILVSEAPVKVTNEYIRVPALEKMLVDFAVDDIFSFLQGTEIVSVYRTAFERYVINENRLLRYAARRGRKKKVLQLIKNARGGDEG